MVLVCVFTYAQNTYNVVIFSEDGEPFFVYANGIRQNDKPETNVKIAIGKAHCIGCTEGNGIVRARISFRRIHA